MLSPSITSAHMEQNNPTSQHLQSCFTAPVTRIPSHQDQCHSCLDCSATRTRLPGLLIPHSHHACSPRSHRLDHSQITRVPFSFSAKLRESFVLQPKHGKTSGNSASNKSHFPSLFSSVWRNFQGETVAALFVFVFGKKSKLIKSKQKAEAVESQRLPCRSSKKKKKRIKNWKC